MNRRELFTAPFKHFKEISEEKESNPEKKIQKAKPLSREEVIMSMGGDFSAGRMAQEVMRLGMDPSNLSEDQMVDLIIAEMQKSRPVKEDPEEETETNNIINS